MLGHGLGDVNPIPSGHAGGADDAATLGVDGSGHGHGEATNAHVGCALLAGDFLHDGREDGLGAAGDIDEKAGGLADTQGRVGQGDEAVVGSQLNKSKRTDAFRGHKAARAAPTGGHRFVCLRDDPGLDET